MSESIDPIEQIAALLVKDLNGVWLEDVDNVPGELLQPIIEALRAQRAAHICECGTTMVCPDIGCDANKLPEATGRAEGRAAWFPKVLEIAGLVNGYHNDATTLSAAETLQAIAKVLGPALPSAPGEAGEETTK